MTETTAIPRRYLHLRGAADTASIRTAQFMGREHVVVPVVALIGGAVVRPMGSKGPEYVPAEELSLVPGSWNGRPVVADHPMKDGAPLSASESPEILASVQFGTVFNTRYESGRLKMDAYVDASRAQEMGGDALSALTRSQAGQSVEVSVGAWVYADMESGVSPSGAPYEYVWREIVPDHLAMLPEGDIGACSVEMGCGAPRIAKETAVPKTKKTRELRAAKDSLKTALEELEPGATVEMSDGEAGVIVYAMSGKHYQRIMGEGGLSEPVEVLPVTDYQPISGDVSEIVYTTTDGETESADESMTTASTCSCNRPKEAATMAEDTTSAVDKLIAAAESPFTEDFRETLSAMSKDKLKPFEDRYLSEKAESEEPAEPVAAKPEPVAEPEKTAPAAEPDPDVVQLTREQYDDLAAASEELKAAKAARKSALVAALREKVAGAYTHEQLQAKEIADLEALSKLSTLQGGQRVDFSGRGLAGHPNTPAYDRRAMPDTYGLEAKEN